MVEYKIEYLIASIVCLWFFFFSGGKEREGDLKYYPFRMTPYLMKVQDAELGEDQFCCLLLAERVHSGYEGENCYHMLSHKYLVFILLHNDVIYSVTALPTSQKTLLFTTLNI